ncbi:ATPase, T2SS/T4P/T4SS family [Clostridium tyrobutyricum]|uniref:ATPase, T2SS/T4P/T4SS family n=1 Tax=Clostridium tyrobutyricum TaxID=1519 RepID=UPI002B1EAE3D|nr:ATPase, T2SS/T4P/T4SS family [Clostridium tyrobutyricum]MEA5009318.1 ATPase, T2SS/T4P/T4SS family [Clostridium tyrobutyricum]
MNLGTVILASTIGVGSLYYFHIMRVKKTKKHNIESIINEQANENLIDSGGLESKLISEREDSIPVEANNKGELNKLLNEMIHEFILKKPQLINAVERGIEEEQSLKREVYSFLDRKAYGLHQKDKDFILKNFERYIWQYGELQELIDSDTISDIKTIDYDNVRIKEKGKRKKSNVVFQSREALKEYIYFVAVKNGAILSEKEAIQTMTDKSSSDKFILRITISSEYVNSVEYPYLHIRKISKHKDDLLKLKAKGMFDDKIEKYLNEGMKSNLTFFLCGKGAVGKTTLLNALIDEIPHDKSGLVIQEAEELYSLKHPDLMLQKVKYAKGESKIQYTLADLSVKGLLTDLDYFVIGEIKGEEAWDMINAIFTGHTALSSVHASGSKEAADKLIHYIRYSPKAADLKTEDLLKMLSSIDAIIFIDSFKVFEITEIAGFNEENKSLVFNPVFKYEISDNKGEFIQLNESCQKVKNKIAYSKFKRNQVKEVV